MNKQSEPFRQILKTVAASDDTNFVIDERNGRTLTPLTLAVLLDALEFVKDLLNYKADPTIPNEEGDCPLHFAAKYNNIECARYLLASVPTSSAFINQSNYSGEYEG